jgi:mRNA interferase RelE/StbE
MSYELEFLPPALEEWKRLAEPIRLQLKKKLAAVLQEPKIPKQKLRGSVNRYKIKLRTIGYRLVYEVSETTVTVTVIAVGKRDKNSVYRVAAARSAQ